MRKKRLQPYVAFAFLCLTAPCLEALGAGEAQVFDQADLLNEDQEERLESRAEELKDEWEMNFLLVTTEDAQGKESQEYADDFCMDHGFYDNGARGTAALLIDMDNRNVWVSTSGDMIYYLTDARIEDVIDAGYEQLRAGDYEACFANMLDRTGEYLDAGIEDDQYTYDAETGRIVRYRSIEPFEMWLAILIALAAAVGSCVWVIGSYRMKWGAYQYPYREKGRLKLDVERDVFTNQVVTTRRIPKDPPPSDGGGSVSSTHTSSGGGKFGGGGRSF